MKHRPKIMQAGLVACLIALSPGLVRAQASCDTDRARRARDAYDRAAFEEVKSLLAPCVPDGFAVSSDRQDALRVMALTYLAEDSVETARAYVRILLRSDSGFQAREDDPPRLVTLVADEKPPWIAWMWQGKSWQRWLARTAVVGAAVAIPLLLVPDAPPAPLPGPPSLPSGN